MLGRDSAQNADEGCEGRVGKPRRRLRSRARTEITKSAAKSKLNIQDDMVLDTCAAARTQA